MAIGSLFDIMQQRGCSPFFFISALQSTVFGEVGRKHQKEIMDSNSEFKERMQSLREEFDKEKLSEQMRFRRESYELGKQYMIEQTKMLIESRRKNDEFIDFVNRYWPLNVDVYTKLNEQENIIERRVIPLQVIIAKTGVSISDNRHPERSYGRFCKDVKENLGGISGIQVLESPWKNNCYSFMCDAMNVNYVMQGIPTLIVFPYQIGNTFGIETAMWSLNRGLHSMAQNKTLKIERDELISTSNAVNAVSAVVGIARDDYMLSTYQLPIQYMKNVDMTSFDEIPEVKNMLTQHYRELSRIIEPEEFSKLCTQKEYSAITQSLSQYLQ